MTNDEDKILKAFTDAGKPLRPGEVADATGIEKKEVSKLIKKLKTEGKVYSPKRCFYDVS